MKLIYERYLELGCIRLLKDDLDRRGIELHSAPPPSLYPQALSAGSDEIGADTRHSRAHLAPENGVGWLMGRAVWEIYLRCDMSRCQEECLRHRQQ